MAGADARPAGDLRGRPTRFEAVRAAIAAAGPEALLVFANGMLGREGAP